VRLFIDRGNTRTKAMLLPTTLASMQPSLTALEDLPVHYLPTHPSAADWNRILPDDTPLTGVWICDAQAQPATAAEWSALWERGPVYCLSASEKPPFPVAYGGNLGPDRLALAWALHALHPQSDALAFSAGTCLTVNAQFQGAFHGGPISPGLSMRLRAMHEQTAALPLAQNPTGPLEWTAPSSTEHALQAGAYYGLLGEIDFWTERWRTKSPEIVVYLTGGDAPALATPLKKGIFAAPKLAFVGLWVWSNEGN
jgi:type III pantothenate kinase